MHNRKLPSVPLEKGFHTELRDIVVPYSPAFDNHLILNKSTHSPYHKSPLWCWKGRLRTLSDSNDGETPIDSALQSCHFPILEYLLNKVVGDDPKSHETIHLLQSLFVRAMKDHKIEYFPILLKLQSQYELTIDFDCADDNGHTAWFYLQQHPLLQKEVEMMLNRSKLEPALKEALNGQLSMKKEKLFIVMSKGTLFDAVCSKSDKGLSVNPDELSLALSTGYSDVHENESTRPFDEIQSSLETCLPHDYTHNEPHSSLSITSSGGHEIHSIADSYVSESSQPCSETQTPFVNSEAKCLEVPGNGTLPSEASNLCESEIQSTKLHQPELGPSGNSKSNICGLTAPHDSPIQSLPRMPRDIVKVLYTFSSEDDDEDDGDISTKKKKKKKKKRRNISRSSSFHFRPIVSGSSSGKSCGAESSSESSTYLASKSLRLRDSQKLQRKHAKRRFINYHRPTTESDTDSKMHGYRLKVKRKKKKSPTGDMESATEDESGELAIPRSDSSVQCNTLLLSGKPLTPPLPMSSELIVEKMLLPRDLPRSPPPTETDKSNESTDPPHPESLNKWKGCFAVCQPKRTVCISVLRRNLCWSLTQPNVLTLKPPIQPSLTQCYVLSQTCSLTNRLAYLHDNKFRGPPFVPSAVTILMGLLAGGLPCTLATAILPNYSTLNVPLSLEKVPPKVNLDSVGGNVQRVISGKQKVTNAIYCKMKRQSSYLHSLNSAISDVETPLSATHMASDQECDVIHQHNFSLSIVCAIELQATFRNQITSSSIHVQRKRTTGSNRWITTLQSNHRKNEPYDLKVEYSNENSSSTGDTESMTADESSELADKNYIRFGSFVLQTQPLSGKDFQMLYCKIKQIDKKVLLPTERTSHRERDKNHCQLQTVRVLPCTELLTETNKSIEFTEPPHLEFTKEWKGCFAVCLSMPPNKKTVWRNCYWFQPMLKCSIMTNSLAYLREKLIYHNLSTENVPSSLLEKLTPIIPPNFSTLNVLLNLEVPPKVNLDMLEGVQCVLSGNQKLTNARRKDDTFEVSEQMDQLTSNGGLKGLPPLPKCLLELHSSGETNELPQQDHSTVTLQSISDNSETETLLPSATCVPSKQQKCDISYQNNFSLWVKDFIHDYGFEKLRESVPDKFHFLLGLSPWKGEHVPKHVLRNILDMARCSRSGFPSYAIHNLDSLSAEVRDVHYCRRPLARCSLTRGEKSKKSKKPKQASSQNVGTLSFSATNRPLEVIRSHLTTYSKCCPRHDIQNIVVVGTTCPASDAFGPKRKYSSIADLKDDTRHSLFNASTSFKEYRDETLKHLSCPSQQVMSDRPMAAMMRDKRMEPMHATGTISSDQHRLVAREPVVSLQGPVNQKHHGHTSSGIHSVCPIAPHSEVTKQAAALHASNDPNPVKRSLQLTSTARESIGRKDSKPEPDTLRSAEHTDPYMEQEKKGDTGAELLHKSRNVTEQSDLLRNVPANRQHAPHYSPSTTQQGEHKECTKMLAELLHAQDYPRILPLSYEGKPPMSLPPEVRIPYVFITALAYYKMSNHKKSVHHFQHCLQLAQECRRYGDITICNIYIGDIEFAQRKYIEAANKYRTALDNYDRDSVAKDFRMILPTKSAVWSKCGSAFKNASRMGDSVAAYEQAIEVATSMKDKLSAHTSLGNLYQGIGENGRAVKEYEDAIALATELKDNVSLGWNHGNLGNALLGLHQRDKALHHLFKALDMAVDYETTPQAIGRAYNNLGTAFQSLSEHDKAEEYYDLALAQAIYGNDVPGQARVYGNIGNLQMTKKHYDRASAVFYFTRVMTFSQDKSTITTVHHNRGCAYYDWAEEKKNALIKKTSSSISAGFKVSLHGQMFERCDEEHRPPRVPDSIQKYYLQGTRDLEYVIKHHEENFSGIIGSPRGLSLSVSLFETNSRTFHRMQDCLVHLKNVDNKIRFEDALLFAEQSRARTLGELLLKRRGPQLKHELVSPPSLVQLKFIVSRQPCPILYLSYTGERLLGWVLFPIDDECSVNMFEVPLSDSEFDGKSFDYHLRYSLNEQLVERSFEMYKPFKHDKDKTDPVAKLYDLVARPLMIMLDKLDDKKQSDDKSSKQKVETENEVRKIIIIPDNYTNLLPFTCTLDRDTGKFWGDKYYFQIMPSLLTMGILDQLPAVSVTIPVQYRQMLCVVGNPTIPPFKYNNDEWNLGKLPHATKEAEWVSHILKCKPILHEQATKDAVMMRIMNAKVIHLATHGSAVAGFLAFAGMSASSNDTVDAKKVLIYPEEIESLNISPALVVLSSCDSGRGVFKADGIQGMARAFILAGAQAVLTTLWRVPDESACIFMQFFYQYLVEGVKGTEALHKAILSLRCFSKYSQYIHWSGYQLTGRELQFDVNQSSMHAELTAQLGPSSNFPRLDIVKRLEEAYLNDPRLLTDVQVLCGPSGVKAFEPLIDFIHSNHHHFTGGVFWINCRTPQLVDASLKYIAHVLDVKEDLSDMPDSGVDQSLVVFDSPGSIIVEDSRLLNFIKNRNVHIVVVSKSFVFSDSLRKLINDRLLRGTITHDVQPLSTIHTTQRIVYSIMKRHSFAPSSSDQKTFEKLAEFTNGSPDIVDVVSSLLQLHFSEEDSILSFADRVGLDELGPSTKPPSMPHSDQFMASSMSGAVRHISQCVYDAIPTVQEYENAWTTSSHYDSWQAMTVLIEQCSLTSAERMLLNCLSVFSCSPIPALLITEIATMICKASHTPFLAPTLRKKLENINFLKLYPKPVVCAPNKLQTGSDVDLFYVPKFIAEALWKDTMTDSDRAMALAVAYKALRGVYTQSPTSLEGIFLSGASSILVEQFELNFALIGKECYQELYRLFISHQQSKST